VAKLLTRLRKTLRQAGAAHKAREMQAYMKSAMPYHGVPVPIVRKLCKQAFADLVLSSASDWRARVLDDEPVRGDHCHRCVVGLR
jgi:3-methyladenine DNA glycosylase AlkD